MGGRLSDASEAAAGVARVEIRWHSRRADDGVQHCGAKDVEPSPSCRPVPHPPGRESSCLPLGAMEEGEAAAERYRATAAWRSLAAT